MVMRSLCARMMLSILVCVVVVETVGAMKKEEPSLQKWSPEIAQNYLNLIILLESGGELLNSLDEETIAPIPATASLIRVFISALEQECSLILIPAALWDYFLHSEHEVINEQPVECKKLFDWTRWDVYKICIDPIAGKFPKDQIDDFYIFCPKDYKIMLLDTSTIPAIKQALAKIPQPITPKVQQAVNDFNQINDLGIALSEEYKVLEPLEEKGPLSEILDKYKNSKITQDRLKIWLNIHKTNFKGKIFNNFLRALTQIIVLKKAQEALDIITNETKITLPPLPQFNVYLHGHGKSTQPSLQLEQVAQRAQQLGFWPGGSALQFTAAEIEEIKGQNAPDKVMEHASLRFQQRTERLKKEDRLTKKLKAEHRLAKHRLDEEQAKPREKLQKFEEENKKFQKDRELVAQELATNPGQIASLPANTYAQMLIFFNGITNVFFVATCHGAGSHLALPFVFMASPSLSYTLVARALLDITTYTSSPSISKSVTLPDKYEIKVSLRFKDFFEGLSDFNLFIQNERQKIKAGEPKNYFSRLLNTVGNFLDEHGLVTTDKDLASNTPWIKLQGNTDWYVVPHFDERALVINDALFVAKELEPKLKIQSPKPEEKSAAPSTWKQMPPQQKAAWQARWGQWEQKRKTPAAFTNFIDAHNKKFIFVATTKKIPNVHFGLTTETKALIPIAKPTSIFEAPLMSFELIKSDDTFTTFFNYVLKPINPSVAIPPQTLITIDKLTCNNDLPINITQREQSKTITLKNCIVLYGRANATLDDFYFSLDGAYFGLKRKQDAPSEYHKVSLDKVLIDASKNKNARLINELIKRGADAQRPDQSGKTALMMAAESENVFVVDQLIKQKVNVDAQDNFGKTALMYATEKSNLAIMQLLIKAKANVNLTESGQGWTALSIAMLNQDKEPIKILLEAGANVKIGNAFSLATTEIKKYIATLLTPQSTGFKKELQTFQQAAARMVWAQSTADKSAINDIIQRGLKTFTPRVPALIRQTEADLEKA